VIGPGKLVLVVGPSGAGKDTLLSLARAACADDPTIVFVQRLVTREDSSAEDNEPDHRRRLSRSLRARRIRDPLGSTWPCLRPAAQHRG
jgi:ribose 1,5-bisphosphokinase PhnN